MDDDIPYLLLTPGPLTTSKSVKQVMLADHCTWDDDYNSIVSTIRQQLVKLAQPDRLSALYTAVLMQGSGTFAVEATIGSVIPTDGKLLVAMNGAYGRRIAQIAERLRIDYTVVECCETEPVDAERVDDACSADSDITHVAVVHCETTTGLLNPVEAIGEVVQRHGATYIIDAMSSFGGIPLTMQQLNCQYLISSANKCIQGVPGFGFVVAHTRTLEASKGRARSLSLDLYDQWVEMEAGAGKWRFTSPTHAVRAFAQALTELEQEGGIEARHERFSKNQQMLVTGMKKLDFQPLLPTGYHSPFITSFLYPTDDRFTFQAFYDALKKRRFVIYPGKVSNSDTFRIGTIGHVFPSDIQELLVAIGEVI